MQTKEIIQKLYTIVQKQAKKPANTFGPDVWETHLLPVIKYAKMLALKRHADVDIVEIAALLHDIASISNSKEIKEHHIHGQRYAQEILSLFHYPQKEIDKVKHCIFEHRGSKQIKRETIEAQCVADGDAMAHFDSLYSLFYLAFEIKKLDPFAGKEFVKEKLERSWNKLTPFAQRLIRDKYKAVKLLLD